jgi:hypothetical protein
LKKNIIKSIHANAYNCNDKSGWFSIVINQSHNSPQNINVIGISINDKTLKNNIRPNLESLYQSPEILIIFLVEYFSSINRTHQNKPAVAKE